MDINRGRHLLALLAGLCAIALIVYSLIDGIYFDALLVGWAVFCAGVGVVALALDYVRTGTVVE